jgi:hypothetical protein
VARDVDIAEELARLINSNSFSRSFKCNFMFDQFFGHDSVRDVEVRVSVESDLRYREGRSNWCRNAEVSVIIIAPQKVNSTRTDDANSSIESLLDLWDEIVDFIQIQSPQGCLAVSLRSFDNVRFDKEIMHSENIFRAGVAITYKLI